MLIEANPYSTIWNKYRPVILKLMVDSSKDPQQYKLFQHEFKAIGLKEKSGYAFVLEVSNGKAVNKIKDSGVARDLLSVLQQSQKASQLMSEATYELKLDRDFMLHVSRKETPPVAETA